MTLLKLRQLLEYIMFQTLLFVVKCLPVRPSIILSEGLAWVMMCMVPKNLSRYDVAKDNLKVAFGESLSDDEANRIIHGMWLHLFSHGVRNGPASASLPPGQLCGCPGF